LFDFVVNFNSVNKTILLLFESKRKLGSENIWFKNFRFYNW
jgi:hypothetical protein